MYQNQNHARCKNKNYLQFCTMFGLTQIVKYPTRITFSSTSLIDHIFASFPERISQECVINVGLSDHQLIALGKLVELKMKLCTKKKKFRSLKNYAVDDYKNALRKINSPNYKNFEDVNQVYSDFFQILMIVIDNAAPCKTKRVKGNTQN